MFGSGNSTAAQRDTVRAAIPAWDALRTFDGSAFTSSTETTTNVNVMVNWVSGTSQTLCPAGQAREIRLNPALSGSNLTYAAMHEAGHSHGIRHSGNQDNLAPDGAQVRPLMGCVNAPAIPAVYADDAAQAFNRFGPRATPNWGFEQGLEYWTAFSAGTSTLPYNGSLAGYLNPSGGTLSTRVRISESSTSYRFTIRYQAANSPVSGTVLFRAWVGTVDYDTFPFSDVGCPEQNFFTEQTGGAVTTPVNVTRVPTTSWALFSQTMTFVAGTEGVRIRIEVINNTNVPIRVDNFALEEL